MMKPVLIIAALTSFLAWCFCAIAGEADRQSERFFEEFTSTHK